MKVGQKYNTSLFGTDSEHYVSRLLMLARKPNGNRGPDLFSRNGDYSPKFATEVKSGRYARGIIVDYQLHYGISTRQQYIKLFGEGALPRQDQQALPGFESMHQGRHRLGTDPVSFYYTVVNRVDGMAAKELDKPFSSIKIKWGDQFMVPHEYAFCAFAIGKAVRTGIAPEVVIEDLMKRIKGDAIQPPDVYSSRKTDQQSWQELAWSEFKAIFENNPRLTSNRGREKISLLQQHYPGLGKLERVIITGPNQTKIYALVELKDYDMFNLQMRGIVRGRIPLIENLSRERETATPLLDRISLENAIDAEMFRGHIPEAEERKFMKSDLSKRDMDRLERLCKWLSEEEVASLIRT